MTAVYGPYRATISDWHDGDSCQMDIDLGFGLILAMSCRCYGIDTPELPTQAGKDARAAAMALCPPGPCTVVSRGWDKYAGRFLGVITTADGQDFGAAMVAAGYARPYSGRGPKPWQEAS